MNSKDVAAYVFAYQDSPCSTIHFILVKVIWFDESDYFDDTRKRYWANFLEYYFIIYIYIYRLRVNLRERCKEYFEKAIISLK